MQYCAAPLSFVLTVIRGPDAPRDICGRAMHMRAVVTALREVSNKKSSTS